MAPHQITMRSCKGRVTFSCGHLSAVHHTNALRRLCRSMVAAGLAGRAEVRDYDGALRLIIMSVEKAARWSLLETDNGFGLRRFEPFPVDLRQAQRTSKARWR